MISMPTPPLDWRNNPIEIGAVIVYATTASSSVYMNEAIVAKIEFVQETRYNHTKDPSDPSKWIRTPYTYDKPVLFVRKTIEHGYGTNSKKDQSKLQKLTRVDRVTVVENPDPDKCNWQGCTVAKNHDDPLSLDYYPAHSWERED